MQLVDLSKPGEKKKLIWAGVLGLAAILVLWWVFIGFDSGTSSTAKRPTPTPAPQSAAQNPPRSNGTVPSPEVVNLQAYTELVYQPASYNPPDARRNIFAYYEPPKVEPKPSQIPTPSPTPPPEVLLASVNPSNVYARTGDFKVETAGDKFTPEMRIYIDGRELTTAFKNPQQLSATVSASFIAAPGTRNVMVRTPDNRLFSNALTINIADPPKPNYTYVGIISPTNRLGDVALVQDKSNRNILSVYKGDVIGGRFRVTSISDKELVLTDTALKIKHPLAMSEGEKGPGLLARPTPRVDSEDDEP